MVWLLSILRIFWRDITKVLSLAYGTGIYWDSHPGPLGGGGVPCQAANITLSLARNVTFVKCQVQYRRGQFNMPPPSRRPPLVAPAA